MSTVKNSAYNSKNGRYALGGLTETSSYALEYWDRKTLERDPTDIVYFLEKKYEGRPDMLGYLFYGDPGLWWIIGQFNTLIDPIAELVEGKVLFIPLIERARTELLNNKSVIGGISSTRAR